MSKPKTKIYGSMKEPNLNYDFILGYNRAVDNYEKFLPNKEDIYLIVLSWYRKHGKTARLASLTQAIAKRIGKK